MLKEEREMTLAAELYEMIAQGWTDEEAHRKQEAFFERIGNAAEGLTHADVWNVWSNALKYDSSLATIPRNCVGDRD